MVVIFSCILNQTNSRIVFRYPSYVLAYRDNQTLKSYVQCQAIFSGADLLVGIQEIPDACRLILVLVDDLGVKLIGIDQVIQLVKGHFSNCHSIINLNERVNGLKEICILLVRLQTLPVDEDELALRQLPR